MTPHPLRDDFGPSVGFPGGGPARLSTGRLLFLVLTFALAPLGAIALSVGLRNIASSDSERQALMSVATEDFAQRLDERFLADSSRLIEAIAAARKARVADTPAPAAPLPVLADDPSDPLPLDADTRRIIAQEAARDRQQSAADRALAVMQPLCLATEQAFPAGDNAPFVQLVDRRSGRNLCVKGVPADRSAIGQPVGMARLVPNERRVVLTASDSGHNIGGLAGNGGAIEIVYPLASLERSFASNADLPRHRLSLTTASDTLIVRDAVDDLFPALGIDTRAPIGRTGLLLSLRAPRTWFNGGELIGLLIPIGMWLLAVLLSWFVIDRILLTPITRLQRSMALYRPGDALATAPTNLLAAREVATLEAVLARLAHNVAEDKAALADGLDQQRALTREVHHRVKNNLQIIASLINLHSRDAKSREETSAFRTIQRRVDALAVVHRHLHAESEGEPGIALGTMLGELSVALRASLALDRGATILSLEVEPARVVQDVALPAAFFVTEIVELASLCDASKAVTIQLTHLVGAPGMARLAIVSEGLAQCEERLGARYVSYSRVLSGLSRQLRQPLEFDAEEGRFAIVVSVID